jgi:CTP synthase
MQNKMDELIVEKVGLKAGRLDFSDWQLLLDRVRNPQHKVRIGLVGKYVRHQDAYKSVYEALTHAGIHHSSKVKVVPVKSDDITRENAAATLGEFDGILVPGGFDKRGVQGKIEAIRFARETGVPFFGICLGLQCAVIEFARNVLNLEDANSTEFVPNCPHPVVCLMDEQRRVTQVGGTMRLGSYKCLLKTNTRAYAAYKAQLISERHRHRYEFNNEYRERFEAGGMTIAGTTEDGALVEVVELANHPWFVGVQSHPEFKSKPTAPHPLFRDFVGAAVAARLAKGTADA